MNKPNNSWSGRVQKEIFPTCPRVLFFLSLFFLAILGTCPVHADSENQLQVAQSNWNAFQQSISAQDRLQLRKTSSKGRFQLSPRLRALYDKRNTLKSQVKYWEDVIALKGSLLKLPSTHPNGASPTLERIEESETIAQTVITAFKELKEKYRMGGSALMSNLAINMGLKKEGFCWHWARDFSGRLRALKLQTYDLYWATAREGTLREHNTVVLVPKGTPFNQGLLIDGWRYSGKPFWMLVAKDKKHPWQAASREN